MFVRTSDDRAVNVGAAPSLQIRSNGIECNYDYVLLAGRSTVMEGTEDECRSALELILNAYRADLRSLDIRDWPSTPRLRVTEALKEMRDALDSE